MDAEVRRWARLQSNDGNSGWRKEAQENNGGKRDLMDACETEALQIKKMPLYFLLNTRIHRHLCPTAHLIRSSKEEKRAWSVRQTKTRQALQIDHHR